MDRLDHLAVQGTLKSFLQHHSSKPSILQHSAFFMGKAIAPHSSTLAWKIPWMEEPGRLKSIGLLRVGHDCMTSLSLFTFMHWRRKWQPTPVFLPGESQGWESLVGCHPWGCTESDTTERLHFHFLFSCIGEGNGNPLQYSCLENPMNRRAWWATIHGVTKSRTRPSDLSVCVCVCVCVCEGDT